MGEGTSCFTVRLVDAGAETTRMTGFGDLCYNLFAASNLARRAE